MECEQVPLIEFLTSDLDRSETEKVLAHLDACPDCRERLRVMGALQAIYSRRSRNRRKYWLLAAGFLALVLTPFLYRIGVSSIWTGAGRLEQLATTEPYPYFPLQTRGAKAPPDLRVKAFKLYTDGNYPAAERAFARLGEDPQVRLYRGITRYLLGMYPEAVVDLQDQTGLDRHGQAGAEWFLGNPSLRLRRLDEAKPILEALKRYLNPYRDRAGSLLIRLE